MPPAGRRNRSHMQEVASQGSTARAAAAAAAAAVRPGRRQPGQSFGGVATRRA
eukprot:COSAG01_NODE_6517_length_3624_cov_8.250873_1_plen_52_part_10